MTDDEREALIEEAAKAIRAEAYDGGHGTMGPDQFDGMCRLIAEVALAVFEQAHTPTDDEREAVEAEAERLWPTGREYSPQQTAAVFSVKELDAYCASAFTRGARYALALRRPVRGEPTDAQIEAALQEWWYGEHEDTWEAKMRAALRTAFQEGQNHV